YTWWAPTRCAPRRAGRDWATPAATIRSTPPADMDTRQKRRKRDVHRRRDPDIGTRTGPLADRKALFLSAHLLLTTVIVAVIAGVFHPSGADPNDHPATFTLYAQSAGWTADHLVQFIGGAIGIAGLIVLYYALKLPDGMPRLAARIGVVSAGVALAIAAIELAVDGVVLKRAVDAWVSAPDADKAARFASAEAVRW